MAVDERNRLQLAEAAKRALRADEGITLMELLPPVGWADVATKYDLAALETRMDTRLDRVDARFDQVDARFVQVDARFDALESRFGIVDARFDQFEDKLVGLEHKMDATMYRELRNQTWKLFALVATAMSAMFGALVSLARF